jgi:hypothetical protein
LLPPDFVQRLHLGTGNPEQVKLKEKRSPLWQMESYGSNLKTATSLFTIGGSFMQTDIEILESRETPGVIWIGR